MKFRRRLPPIHSDAALSLIVISWKPPSEFVCSCEGGVSAGIMGYIWESAGSSRIPLYRCVVTNATGVDHFVSVDSQCEGQQIEGVLGYVDP